MTPVRVVQFPAWPDTCPDDDPMLAARGVVFTVILSLPFWFAVALLVWWMST
jgi:hypothetical protein